MRLSARVRTDEGCRSGTANRIYARRRSNPSQERARPFAIFGAGALKFGPFTRARGGDGVSFCSDTGDLHTSLPEVFRARNRGAARICGGVCGYSDCTRPNVSLSTR